jgi:predicted RNA-binding Zn-ribbon protein involved in translation (DUF1610 family)
MKTILTEQIPEGTKGNCPNCGNTLIVNKEKLSIHHEMPTCEWYEAICEQFGATTAITIVSKEKTN